MKKPTLAIISSYDDLCGNASYTRALEENLSRYFDVTVFNLITTPYLRNNKEAVDRHIDWICANIAKFDLVNIQFEGALYGDTENRIKYRVKKLIKASSNVIVTFHRVDVDVPLNIHSLVSKLRHLNLMGFLREVRAWMRAKSQITKFVVNCLKERSLDKPYQIIVHRQLDVTVLKYEHDCDESKILAYPLVYFSNEKVQSYKTQFDSKVWRQKHGIPVDKRVLGVFGFMGQYKGYVTAMQALVELPEEYCLIVAGGQHPMSIKPMHTDPTVIELQELMKSQNSTLFTAKEKERLLRSVYFLGVQETDADMEAALCATDYVLLPYHEVGQSGSGIATMAFELERKLVLSRNVAFTEFRKFFPDSFESVDIGNVLELKHKILNYDDAKVEQAKRAKEKYNAEALAKIYSDLYKEMSKNEIAH